MNRSHKSPAEFPARFRDDAACRAYLEFLRFRNGEYCPHCGHTRINRYQDGLRFRCARCTQDFRIGTRTIFGESRLPLCKWFMAVQFLSTAKNGLSSIELSRRLGVRQSTAWSIDQRIRKALKHRREQSVVRVKADAMPIAGKEKNGRKKARAGETENQAGAHATIKQKSSKA